MDIKKDDFIISEEDLIKFQQYCKSKEFEKVIEKFNEDAERRRIEEEDKRIRDGEWWDKNKNIPFNI